jgi:hypothetical protein
MKKQKEIVLYVEGREPAVKKRNAHHNKSKKEVSLIHGLVKAPVRSNFTFILG